MRKRKHYIVKIIKKKTGDVKYHEFSALKIEAGVRDKEGKLLTLHFQIDRHRSTILYLYPKTEDVTIFKETMRR